MKSIRATLLAVVFLCLPLASLAQTQTHTHRVLFAITSPDQQDWTLMLGNISHVRQDLSPDSVEVEVVAYGPAMVMLKKSSPVQAEIVTLEKDGVVFVACENSMHHMQLTKTDLIEGSSTVPSGVAEVVKKEEAGWTYIRAGR